MREMCLGIAGNEQSLLFGQGGLSFSYFDTLAVLLPDSAQVEHGDIVCFAIIP